jgi:hypothetical protein
VTLDKSEIRAAFDQLATIQQRLGRLSYAALRKLLPFSRNDEWEVSELKQRVARE